MKKIWQKSLASMVSAALCLTAFVGCLTVNAADYQGTVTSEGASVTTEEAQATVTLTLSSTSKAMNVAAIKVSTKYGALASVGLVENKDDNYKIEKEGIDLASGKLFVEAIGNNEGFTTADVVLTFNKAEKIGEGTYPVEVLAFAGDTAASWDEKTINLAVDGAINITVTSSHTHVYDTLKNDETNHWYECECGKTNGLEAHTYGAGVVTKQPTTTTTGVMTYTCSTCGYVKTEDIAIPEDAGTAITFKGDINVSSVVGASITLSTKQMRTKYGDASSYFIVAEYQKYGDGYMLTPKSVKLTAADRIADSSTANKDVLLFKDVALYEMTLDFTLTAYFKNGDGVVVGYKTVTTNIADMALSYAPTAGSNLLTALADMCNYGAAAQEYFAAQNAESDICNAVLPTTIFADYMGNASSTDGMPAAGSYNNDKSSNKVVSTTGFVSAGQTLNLAASNQIQYTLRYDNYDFKDVEIKVHYEDSLAGHKEVVLTEADLKANGTAGNGQPKYLYYFTDLALYDCDTTVTMDMYYKGNLELTSVYSLGNFVNSNLSNAQLGSVLTYMELFSNSAGVALTLPSRW
ncbi:MAG: hypothetical protein ACI4FN_04880 [Acutalibacteraceae bacterium]